MFCSISIPLILWHNYINAKICYVSAVVRFAISITILWNPKTLFLKDEFHVLSAKWYLLCIYVINTLLKLRNLSSLFLSELDEVYQTHINSYFDTTSQQHRAGQQFCCAKHVVILCVYSAECNNLAASRMRFNFHIELNSKLSGAFLFCSIGKGLATPILHNSDCSIMY